MLNRRTFLGLAGSAGLGLLTLPGLVGASPTGGPRQARYQVIVPSEGTGLVGTVTDVLTGRPVTGVIISSNPLNVQAISDAQGEFILRVPPGTYTITTDRTDYVGLIRAGLTVTEGYRALDLELIPTNADESQQQALYDALVKQTSSPLPEKGTGTAPGMQALETGLPAQIRVRYRENDPCSDVWVPLEDYIKGVVPNEVPALWPAEALKTQAVAARTYGVRAFRANGFVYPDTRSQVYDPNNRYASTDAAVDATSGQVITTGGAIIDALFFSRCNGLTTRNSEDAIIQSNGICKSAGWNYVSYCRARSCTGHAASDRSDCGYYGHGVGVCQWGSYYQAGAGRDYRTILTSYYTGIEISSYGISALSTTSEPAAYRAQSASYQIYLPTIRKDSCG